MCRPLLVSTMVDHFSHAFDVPNQLNMAEYDARTDAALTRFVATLPPNAGQLLLGQLDEALAERELSWRNVLSGVEEAMQDQPTPFAFGTLEASPQTMAMGTTSTPLAQQTLEDPGPHRHWRGHERASQACSRRMSRMAPGELARGCSNLGTLRSITRGCGA